MLRYGSDKPDLRNPLVIVDASEAFRGSGFTLFARAVEGGSVVRAIGTSMGPGLVGRNASGAGGSLTAVGAGGGSSPQ